MLEEERREAPRRVRRADRYKDEERVAAEMPEIPEEAAVREVSDDTLVLAKTQEALDDTLVLTKTQESPDDAAVLAEPQETSTVRPSRRRPRRLRMTRLSWRRRRRTGCLSGPAR